MLKLLCGPSGSGKTTALINSIRNDVQNQIRCYLLVPEQQAYISEMEILSSLPQNAGLYFEIVNFSGLARDVFSKYGGITGSDMSQGGKSLLMWDTLRLLSPMLSQFGKNAKSDLSLTGMMLSTVEELKASGVTVDTLVKASEELGDQPILQKKLSDIAAVLELYSHKTKMNDKSDSGELLSRMTEKLQKHDFFANCNVYIDSFTDFTALEFGVIREILKQASSLTVALSSDRLFSDLPHFATASETARKMVRMANEMDVEVIREILPPSQTKRPKSLQIIERDLWRFALSEDAKAKPPLGDHNVVEMHVCKNIYEESEATALHILELIQGGMRYEDIAIVVRDIEGYRGVLDAAMERHGIPYFLSERTDLASKPLSRLILSALNAIEKNYRQQDVIALLKTGLTGVSVRDAALFEEYCQTWHISGSRFREDAWSMNPDGLVTTRTERAEEILQIANRVRKEIILPLEHLAADMRASKQVCDRCRAIYNYMERIHIADQLLERAKAELSSNRAREAGETVRLYAHMTQELTETVRFLPDTELTLNEFIAALTLLLSAADLGSVPNSHDCVTIGSADLIRVEKIKVSFLLGLCEGEFPRSVTDDSLLSNADRLTLDELGIHLGANEQIRSSNELFYVYRAMTKPTERLFLSTVTSQPDGTVRTPSLAFTRVRYLLDLPLREFDLDAVSASEVEVQARDVSSPLSLTPAEGVRFLRLSQTKIQTFLQCPYRYYSTYVLKLRDKKDATPSYSDDGTFLHYVFEHFLRSAKKTDGTLEIPADEELDGIADAILERYLAEVCPFPVEIMDSRLLHLFSRLRSLALRMLGNMIEELRVSQFRPHTFEHEIGAISGEGLPPFTIELNNGNRVLLTGKIDRIDILEENGKIFFRIIDYKSGKHDFSLKDIKTGGEIQLVLYLFSVLASNPDGLCAAGAQYLYASVKDGRADVTRSGFILDNEELLAAADTSEDARFVSPLIKRSFDEILELEAEMKNAVSQIADRILAGDVSKTPSEKACGYCPIRNHCNRAYHA